MALILFAHGAGAGPESSFMQAMSSALTSVGHKVECITFPYWQQVLASGKKRPPDKAAVLDAAFIAGARSLKGQAAEQPLFVMGKSMGARVAFRCADELNAKAAIGLGFPFHPPKAPEKHRLLELVTHRQQNLIVHGTRDPFGKPEWLAKQLLPSNIMLQWCADGDHDLRPLKRTGTEAAAWNWVAGQVAEFIATQLGE